MVDEGVEGGVVGLISECVVQDHLDGGDKAKYRGKELASCRARALRHLAIGRAGTYENVAESRSDEASCRVEIPESADGAGQVHFERIIVRHCFCEGR